MPRAGTIIGYVVGGILVLFGAVYLCSASAPGVNVVSRLIVGVILVVVGIAVVWVVRTRGPRPIQQIVQQVELDMPGDISLEKLKCQNCGAELDKDSVTLAEGAAVINCPYCGSTYQITEEPKW